MFHTVFQHLAHLLHVIVFSFSFFLFIKKIQALDRKTTKPNQKQISDSFFVVFHLSTVV